jgi:uncharacterized protein (UPF0264 family)
LICARDDAHPTCPVARRARQLSRAVGGLPFDPGTQSHAQKGAQIGRQGPQSSGLLVNEW